MRPTFIQLMLLLLPFSVMAQDAPEKVSKPFEYSGYSAPTYSSLKVLTDTAPMSDGKYLAVDVYLPTEGPKQKAFPVIVQYLPYQRATVDLETGKVRDLSGGIAKFFTQYGYAFVTEGKTRLLHHPARNFQRLDSFKTINC